MSFSSSETIRSVLIGQSALYVLAAVALFLTVTQRLPADSAWLRNLQRTFVAGIACQCVHFIEELVTGFHVELPRLLGLVPWSIEFFVVFNVAWIAVWVLALAGIEARMRVAFFPVWFFVLAMVANAVWHPLLALAKQSYFPGLFTSPLVGVAGIRMVRQLWQAKSVTADMTDAR